MPDLGAFGVAEREVDPDAEPFTFTFCGQEFTVSDHNGSMPWLRWASAATSGISVDDPEALAVTYDLLRDSLSDADWARFQSTATRNRARTDDLLKIVYAIWEAETGRPTRRPSDSSDGSPPDGSSSRGPSSSAASSVPELEEGVLRTRRPGRIMSDPRVSRLQPVNKAARRIALAPTG